MINKELIKIRQYNQSDIPYIYSSWMEEYYSMHFLKTTKVNDNFIKSNAVHIALMPKRIYYKESRKKIDLIISKSQITIVCNAEDESQIMAYAVHRLIGNEITVLSWIYVRPIFRKFGLCKHLMDYLSPIDVITHVNPNGKSFLKKFNLIYNPYMEDGND